MCAREVAGDAAVMVQCRTYVPPQFAVELPCASIRWIYVCYHLGSRKCYGCCSKVVRAVDVCVRRECWISTGVPQQVEREVGLWYEAVPLQHREVWIHRRYARLEVFFPRLNCALG